MVEQLQPLERAQLDHILLDVDFMHKPTIRALRKRYGWVSVLWLIECYSQMSRATNARIDDDTALATAEDMDIENGQELLDYCLLVEEGEKEGLMRRELGKLTNSRVIKDQEALQRKRETTLKRVTQHRKDNTSNAPVTRYPDTVTVSVSNINNNSDVEVARTSEGVKITPSQYTKEQLIFKLKNAGLDASDLPDAIDELARHYDAKPDKIGRNCLLRDINASWLRKVLLDAKYSRERVNRQAQGSQEREQKPKTQSSQKLKTPSEALDEVRQLIERKNTELEVGQSSSADIVMTIRSVGWDKLTSPNVATFSEAEKKFIQLYPQIQRQFLNNPEAHGSK